MKTFLTLAALGLGIGAFATAGTAQADHFPNRHFHQHHSHHQHGQFGGHGFGNGFGSGYRNGFGNGFGNGYRSGFGNGFGNGFGSKKFGHGGFRPGFSRQAYRGNSGFHMSFNLYR